VGVNVSTSGKGLIFRDTAFYSLSGALYALTPLALMPLLTRKLTVEEYGYYILISSAIGILIPFIGFGAANSVIVRYFSLTGSKLSIYLSSVIRIMILSFFFYIFVILALPESLLRLFHPGTQFLLFSACMAFLSSFALLFASLYVASADAIGYLRAYASYGISILVSTVLFCGVLDYGLIGACLGMVCGHATFAIASCVGSKVAYLRREWATADALDAIRLGSPLMIHSAAGVFISFSDRFAVSNWLGAGAVASYGVSAQLALMIGYFFHSVNKVIQPRIYALLKSGNASQERLAISYVYLYCIAVLLIAFMYALIFPMLVLLFAGISFQVPLEVYGFVIVGSSFNAMYLAFSHFVFFRERTLILSLVTFLCAIVYFVALIGLTPRFGLSGVAFSFALVNGLMLLFTVLIARSCTTVRWFDRSLLKCFRLKTF
jgi:O-antigen/teichoic acid export membrane protein